jgi:4-hydroxy-tetrahydrodipicolinate reductase
MPMKFAVAGATGKMGKMLIETILRTPNAQLTGALEHPSSGLLGQDAGGFLGQQTNVLITSDLQKGLAGAEYLIDFTRPEGTLVHAEAAKKAGVKMIIGTTGFTADQLKTLQSAASLIAIVFAPNMSVGVNATFKLIEMAAKLLNQGYDIEIVEAHHRHKVDAPSGTAIKMGEVIAQAQGQSLKELAVYAREGHTGARPSGSIGFATIRGGDIVGDHTVIFAGEGERIEISHKSSSRQSYAEGALRAAAFLQNHSKGWFDMQDVLGLKNT